jgi:hypothetical protein
MEIARKTRIITTAWGDSYVSELLEITLPALLAPGNLPALVRHFDVEFVLVTETREFDAVRAHPVFRALERICPARLIACDDLVVSRKMYGHSLTHCLHRGFEDLGPAMCDWNLLFLNSDFILADGSYAVLAESLLAGDRLIFAPSYCAVSENVLPALRARFEPAAGSLAVAKREMAALILANRHDTIRAKTINARAFHMDVSDQFYWYVDEHTLLGRQMPIALVAMRPERPYVEPVSFWDYATIAMAAPSLPKRVLGDSDEFLMLELRKADTFAHLMRAGEMPIGQIARVLGYMTQDQYDMGRFDLTLHARDLPDGVDRARTRLAEHVGAVYAQLPLATDHRDHPYWINLIGEFRHLRDAWRKRNANDAVAAVSSGEFGESGSGALRALWGRIFGRLPRPTLNHPAWAVFRDARAAIDEAMPSAKRVLVVRSDGGVLDRLFDPPARAHVVRVSPYGLRAHGLPAGVAPFDLCVLDLDWAVARDAAQDLHPLIRSAMRDGGRIVMRVAGKALDELAPDRIGALPALVPRLDFPKAFYAGGPAVARAHDGFADWLEARAGAGPIGKVLGFAWLAWLVVRARRANRRAADADPTTLLVPCRAVTIVVDVRKAETGG